MKNISVVIHTVKDKKGQLREIGEKIIPEYRYGDVGTFYREDSGTHLDDLIRETGGRAVIFDSDWGSNSKSYRFRSVNVSFLNYHRRHELQDADPIEIQERCSDAVTEPNRYSGYIAWRVAGLPA